MKVNEARYELYDLASDPLEEHDLIAAGEVPQEASGLLAQIALWVATGTNRIEPATSLDPEMVERLRAIGYF